MDPDGGKNQAYLDGLYLSDYNLMKILDLVILNSGLAVMGCWALAEVCTQLSAIPA